ncbi:hypothetical protein KFK09_009546 [Dendrobium nobile]|uniref:Uncharacterized protein n=1 Tax=Dendrobium nobile TaxID=94219 RepID=A0A8T3BJK6_DENNO|nr:hypothetical protein KFK09_009546 [Dendrobium nobile]
MWGDSEEMKLAMGGFSNLLLFIIKRATTISLCYQTSDHRIKRMQLFPRQSVEKTDVVSATDKEFQILRFAASEAAAVQMKCAEQFGEIWRMRIQV